MELRTMTEEALVSWHTGELVEAFPPHERKPLEEILALCHIGRYDPLGFYEGEVLAGYAMVLTHPQAQYVLLDYLGVTAARRGGGLGGTLLSQVQARYKDKAGILAEAEDSVPGEENELRERRIAFYGRNGFHPVYRCAGCGVRFHALLSGTIPADLTPVMADHRLLYGPEREDIQIPLRPDEEPKPPYWMNR